VYLATTDNVFGIGDIAANWNKLIVLIDWIQNYINYDRPLGIIIRKYHREEMSEEDVVGLDGGS